MINPAGWWQRQREQRALQRRAIPDDLWKRTLVRYPFLRRQDRAEADELRRLTSLFLDRKEFHPVGGLRLTDMMAVTIAAQAVLPVLKLGLKAYDGFVGIVVHPAPVRATREQPDDSGVVHAWEEELSGEAMEGGPVMLSWHDVRQAGASAAAGYNLVIHEFAHVLDMADGSADGVPPLPPDIAPAEWQRVLTAEFEGFVAAVEAAEAEDREPECVIDPYGASAPEEFFAVASEAFFVSAARLQAEHPLLYALFSRFYRQDPAAEPPFRPSSRHGSGSAGP
jgi:Mlc titration factor MtfA (ptsG expression regulator)